MATYIGNGLNNTYPGTINADYIEGRGGNDRLHGAGGADRIFGGAGSDYLWGDAGNDALRGNAGNDFIYGGLGADNIDGGLGLDYLTGGAGNDIFRFNQAYDSSARYGIDRILDFDDFGNDRIDLSHVFAGTLVYKGAAAFTGAGQVRIADIAGPDLLVQVNLGGTLAPEMTIRLVGTTALSMSKADFIL